jgi:uncharacterized coiled-coil protein SlyX
MEGTGEMPDHETRIAVLAERQAEQRQDIGKLYVSVGELGNRISVSETVLQHLHDDIRSLNKSMLGLSDRLAAYTKWLIGVALSGLAVAVTLGLWVAERLN